MMRLKSGLLALSAISRSRRSSQGAGLLVHMTLPFDNLSDARPPQLNLAGSAGSYPPQLAIHFDDMVMVGDTIRLQAASDTAFVYKVFDNSLVISEESAVRRSAGFPGLSAISAPSQTYFRARVERGAQVTAWSENIKHGDTQPPKITSSAEVTFAENAPLNHALTADEAVSWSMISGKDAGLLEITGSTLRLSGNAILNFESKAAYSVIVRATDAAGNRAEQQVTVTVSNIDEQANSLAFSPIKNAPLGNIYISNSVIVSGLAPGVSVPVTISGGRYSKNRAAFTKAAGYVSNGDTLSIQAKSSDDYLSIHRAILTLGSGAEAASASFAIEALADPQGVDWRCETPPPIKEVNYTAKFADFANINFGKGLGIVVVLSGCPIDAVDVGGVPARLLVNSAYSSIWSLPIIAPGPRSIRISSSAQLMNWAAIVTGTMITNSPIPVKTASLSYGYYPSPLPLGENFTVPSHGLGLVVAFSPVPTAMPEWSGAEEEVALTSTSKVGTVNLRVARVIPGGKPAVAGWGYVGTSMCAAAWIP